MMHLPAIRSHLDEDPCRLSRRDIKILAGRKPIGGSEPRTSMSQSRPCGVYFVGHDTTAGDLKGTGVPLVEVRELFDQSRSRRAFLWLDFCHSGGITARDL